MKQVKFLGLAALLVAVVAGSAFKVTDGKIAKRFAGKYFVYNTTPGSEYLPNSYTVAGPQSQNTQITRTNVDWLFVDDSEIYPVGHATAGKPKVNDATTEIQAAIIDALLNDADQVISSPFQTEVELKP